MAAARTELAWNRSGLAVVVCIAVLLRRVWLLHTGRQALALACLSVGALAWALALVVGRHAARRAGQGWTPLGDRRAMAMTVGTLALALGGVVLSFFPPP